MVHLGIRSVMIALVIAVCSLTWAQQPPLRLALLDLRCIDNTDSATALSIADALRAELNKTELYHALPRSEMNALLAGQRFQVNLSCDSLVCAAAAGLLLGVDRVMWGAIHTTGSTIFLITQMVQPGSGRQVVYLQKDITPQQIPDLVKTICLSSGDLVYAPKRAEPIPPTPVVEEIVTVVPVKDSARVAVLKDSLTTAMRRDSARVFFVKDSILAAVYKDSIHLTLLKDSLKNAFFRDSMRVALLRDSIKSVPAPAQKKAKQASDLVVKALLKDSIRVSLMRDSIRSGQSRDSIRTIMWLDSMKSAAVKESERLRLTWDSLRVVLHNDSIGAARLTDSLRLVQAKALAAKREPVKPKIVVKPSYVKVTVKPAHALIVINGVYAGRGESARFSVAPGRVTVRCEAAGYAPDSISSSVKPGQEIVLTKNLATKLGSIKISSKPDSVHLSINTVSLGTTPFANGSILPGTYSVALEKVHFEKLVRDIVVSKGETAQFKASLRHTKAYNDSMFTLFVKKNGYRNVRRLGSITLAAASGAAGYFFNEEARRFINDYHQIEDEYIKSKKDFESIKERYYDARGNARKNVQMRNACYGLAGALTGGFCVSVFF